MPAVEIPVTNWVGRMHEVRLGGDSRKSIVVGGESTLPFLYFEGSFPHRPAIAIEIQDIEPTDWASPLLSVWGEAVKNTASWAKQAALCGADIIALRLASAHPEQGNTSAARAKAVVEEVLGATDLPLVVLGTEVAEKDNEVLVAASEAAKGQRIALGNCSDRNYRTIATSCLANGHIAIARTPNDVNLAKQLNILLHEAGLPLDSMLNDTTTGSLGYGLEYTYSVIERLRLACLTGDEMTSAPIICTIGEESWRQKESIAASRTPAGWGTHLERSVMWEALTASSLITAGASIIVLRHPATVELIKQQLNHAQGERKSSQA